MLKVVVAMLVLLANPVFAIEVDEAALKGSWKIISYNGKIHSMSPSVYYITDGHLLEFDFGVVDISQLDKKTMGASVSGTDFVFEKVSDKVYVKPKAKEKTIPKEAAVMAFGMAQFLIGNGEENADTLSCPKAVKDSWRFLDQAMLQAEINFNDGYMTRQELADGSKKLKAMRDAIDVASCGSSEGDTRKFYLCLSNPKNILLYCADKYKFNMGE